MSPLLTGSAHTAPQFGVNQSLPWCKSPIHFCPQTVQLWYRDHGNHGKKTSVPYLISNIFSLGTGFLWQISSELGSRARKTGSKGFSYMGPGQAQGPKVRGERPKAKDWADCGKSRAWPYCTNSRRGQPMWMEQDSWRALNSPQPTLPIGCQWHHGSIPIFHLLFSGWAEFFQLFLLLLSFSKLNQAVSLFLSLSITHTRTHAHTLRVCFICPF